MFSKLSLKNMRRSIKDYTVYFLTLTLAVCIFYMFNALGEQNVMLELSQTQANIFMSLSVTLGIVSIFVVLVLAFLVIYANKFMIKRRKKEFGIYMLLGMPQRKISSILVIETLLIGLLALGSGLLIGFFASQGLSVAAAYLLNVQLKNYSFYFSLNSLYATLICFGAIFLIVMLFNARTISKLKLIDLLKDENKNEEQKIRNKPAMIICFIAGIFVIAYSYYFVLSKGAEGITFTLGPGLLINTGGTILFFISVSSIYISVLQKDKKRYFHGLKMFSCRQMASKVNSNSVSMAFICEMLFLTIVILSTVSGYNSIFQNETNFSAPYDISFQMTRNENSSDLSITDAIKEAGIDTNAMFEEGYAFDLYPSGLKVQDFIYLDPEDLQQAQRINETELDMIKVSDFNKLMQMQNKDAVQLDNDQFSVTTFTDTPIQSQLEEMFKTQQSVTINGNNLTASGSPRFDNVWTSNSGFRYMLFIVPNETVSGIEPDIRLYSANYSGDKTKAEEYIRSLDLSSSAYSDDSSLIYSTKMLIAESNGSLSAILIFVGLYLGIVFLIAGAAILALQQLTEASDSRRRYDLLRKIGASEKMITGALFGLVSAYFLLPLGLAAIHSIFGIAIMFEGLTAFMGANILIGALCAAAVIIIIYGGYFLATYFGCKNIIKPTYSQLS